MYGDIIQTHWSWNFMKRKTEYHSLWNISSLFDEISYVVLTFNIQRNIQRKSVLWHCFEAVSTSEIDPEAWKINSAVECFRYTVTTDLNIVFALDRKVWEVLISYSVEWRMLYIFHFIYFGWLTSDTNQILVQRMEDWKYKSKEIYTFILNSFYR